MRKKISLLSLISFVLLCIGFMSFQPNDRKDEIEQLISKEVEKKLENYKAIRFNKCREKILKDAAEQADSIIIARAKGLKVMPDTMNRPLAPNRPERPELLEPIDSSFATPLLENLDSLIEEKD